MSALHIWDGYNIIAETEDDEITAVYLRGLNLIMCEDDSQSAYYLFNAHGDVVQLTNDIGSIVMEYSFDAFGNQQSTEEDASGYKNPFRYCGEYFDVETGLLYLRARYYDAASGRFISEDPIRHGLNWYAYCNGNPLMFIDPSGEVAAVIVPLVLREIGKVLIKTTAGYFKGAPKALQNLMKSPEVAAGIRKGLKILGF